MLAQENQHPLPSSAPVRVKIAWRTIILFVIFTFGLTWLVVSPLFFITNPGTFQTAYLVIAVVMMCIPGLVAWVLVRRTAPKGQRAAALGFARHRPGTRLLGYLGLAFAIPIALGVLSLVLASILGLYEFDLANLSGLQQVFAQAGVTGIPTEALLLGQLVNMVLAAWVINLLPALGEEIGWRGWLTPQLLPLGVVPTVVITGVVWGLWHTPLLLLGHNYPHLPAGLSVLYMVVFCTLFGAIFAWLSIRTNSVWPAALGHSTVNATAGLPVLFSTTPNYDPAVVGITGITGWVVTAAVVVVLLWVKSFKRAPQPPVNPATAWPGDIPPTG